MHGIIYFVNGQGCRMFGHRIRAWRINSFVLPSKLSTIFPVMVPEYIDIPVVLLAQKYIDNKIKKKWATQKNIYNYLFPNVAYSSFRTSFFVWSVLFSVVVLCISMTFGLKFLEEVFRV